MPSNAQELERLFVTLLADDSGLQRSFDRIVEGARRTADEVSRAFEVGMTVLRQGVAAATESLVDAASRARHELIELERRCPRDEGN